MAAEMPARVEAVENAVVVNYPWAAATSAVAALNAASSTLGEQLGTRAGMGGTLSDWVGTFRTDFDEAYQRITSTGSGLKERLSTLASQIVSGAEDANEEQRQNNYRAEHPPVPAGGRAIPE
jgi:uncharacterized protein YukE